MGVRYVQIDMESPFYKFKMFSEIFPISQDTRGVRTGEPHNFTLYLVRNNQNQPTNSKICNLHKKIFTTSNNCLSQYVFTTTCYHQGLDIPLVILVPLFSLFLLPSVHLHLCTNFADAK